MFSLYFFKLKEGNKITFKLEKENNKAKNGSDKTDPMFLLWISDRH